MTIRHPLPPFTRDMAIQKVRAAENAWNSRVPASVALTCTPDSCWRSRSEFLSGRTSIEAFLTRTWESEQEYRLIKELWAVTNERIAVRFVSECRKAGQWWRCHGNVNWHIASDGLVADRHASINDVAIAETERLFLWPLGVRPIDHPGLTELGL